VSIWGSADGETWTKKPLLKLPQQFYYRGTTKMILDLSLRPETKLISRSLGTVPLGQGSADTHVVAGLELAEIPPMSRETPTARRGSRSQVISAMGNPGHAGRNPPPSFSGLLFGF